MDGDAHKRAVDAPSASGASAGAGNAMCAMSKVSVMPKVDERGLDAAAVAERVAKGMTNAVRESTSRSLGAIVRANVCTMFNAIILTAMVVVLAAGAWQDAVFGFVILINTGIGIATELRAKLTLDRLSILVASRSLVRRDGVDVPVAHGDIVMDDLLWIRAGEQVPADATIVRTWGLELDESMLTGESATVRKREGQDVHSGSTAVAGMALATVIAVGERSYAARLTAEARVYRRTVSDLSRGIATILTWMSVVVVPLCALLVWSQLRTVGGWQEAMASGQWRHAVVSAVAGVVGMIPEGLVLLTSLNFAIAAMRLARRGTLVQELESVETLARVDCLNLDKTGTITDGGVAFVDMVMLDGSCAGGPSYDETVQALADLCGEEHPNATGRAVLTALRGRGVSAVHVADRVPFSSTRKWSAIVREDGRTWYLGAPEVLARQMDGDATEVLRAVNDHAGHGNRVLMVAMAEGADGAADPGVARGDGGTGSRSGRPDPDGPATVSPSARPISVVLCAESVRQDARDTLAWFREQGVRCRVISGDNPVTVGAIAAKVALTGERPPRCMDARNLPEDIDALSDALEDIDVLGRVLPEQKKAIVQALHRRGHVVAMTGDGVNDALAIKEADLGVAMGNAAGATKAVAQVVLVDSRFSHLPDVVARGRQVMANMERVASLFLVKTVYSALVSLAVVLSASPFPYLPRHITYVGALTIGMPAFLLALAPNTRRYLPGFLRRVLRFALPCGVAVAICVMLCVWLMPSVMGWDMAGRADLESMRATCAMVLLVLGMLVLAAVARPLRSWRGLLVLGFAFAAFVGLLVPQVASFFALQVPQGRLLVPTVVALAVSAVVFASCHAVAPVVERIVSHGKPTRQP